MQAGVEERGVQRGVYLTLAGRQGDPAKGGAGPQIQFSDIPERGPVIQAQMVETGIKGTDIHRRRAVPPQRGKVRWRQTVITGVPGGGIDMALPCGVCRSGRNTAQRQFPRGGIVRDPATGGWKATWLHRPCGFRSQI